MKRVARRSVVGAGLAAALCACASTQARATGARFTCPPCACGMDGVVFTAPGTCPACGMTLVATEAETTPFEPGALPHGASVFLARGGRGREDKRVAVHTYKPRAFTPDARVLLVIPGAGRNGNAYRDAWIETAERANVLVAAMSYAEADYDFAAYHLGGVVRDLEIRNMPTGPNGRPLDVIHVRDEDISFRLNPDRATWLYNDFDRIFALLVRAAGSTQRSYDMFGHSAGGQILHRFTLFQPRSAAERIVAANAGFYTLPDLGAPQPVGLRDTGVTNESLRQSFACRLTVLLGENDNGDEAGGIQIHTPLIDRQGIGRLARGRTFFATGQERARALGAPFNWSLQTVPNVGHDFRGMTRAAAQLLYGV